MRRTRKNPPIEFKGNTLPVIVVTLRSLLPDELAGAANEIFGGDTFFDGDAALLELSRAGDAETADWAALRGLFGRHGLRVVGVRGAGDALGASAALAGLPNFPAAGRTVRQAAQEAPHPAPPPALFVDRPLRSGQQIYARGGDLVVLAAVSSGAEVIADGSIHVYAPLRGRALAGASGAPGARIFTTRFEAELVSVAGVYRTFEAGVPADLAGQPVQVRLSEAAGDGADRLAIVTLKID
ncbi:MAG: septum site-determining protein MinC [Betaproteobacteria bacterium]|nr:septum site-determining protein MinC [Betaproteobacteria bacterium]